MDVDCRIFKLTTICYIHFIFKVLIFIYSQISRTEVFIYASAILLHCHRLRYINVVQKYSFGLYFFVIHYKNVIGAVEETVPMFKVLKDIGK